MEGMKDNQGKCENSANNKEECFSHIFCELRKDLRLKLLQCKDKDVVSLPAYFDQIVSDFQKLQKLLSDNTMFMPAYDIKIAQEALRNLQEDIKNMQDVLLPKKKFSFRNKSKFNCGSDGARNVLHTDGVAAYRKLESLNFIGNMADTIVSKTGDEINRKDISLSSMQSCKIYLYGAPSTLLISDLFNCQVFTGPVSSSVYIENCKSCTFVIACQQLRVHNSSVCIFYLHISSRTIIEDCSSLQFAPYNWTYAEQNSDFVNAGLEKSQNVWEAVDDFNWLVSGCPSPNWSFLPKEKYVSWT